MGKLNLNFLLHLKFLSKLETFPILHSILHSSIIEALVAQAMGQQCIRLTRRDAAAGG